MTMKGQLYRCSGADDHDICTSPKTRKTGQWGFIPFVYLQTMPRVTSHKMSGWLRLDHVFFATHSVCELCAVDVDVDININMIDTVETFITFPGHCERC